MRIADTPISDMDAAQRAAYEAVVAGPRGGMPAPMRAWIRVPELAHRAQQLGAFALFGTRLPPRLREIAILTTARHWTAQYEWHAHRTIALEAGLEPTVVDAIAAGEAPDFADEAGGAVYAFSRMLLERRNVDDATYERTVRLLGEACVVELVGVLGYYGLVSMTLNVFEIGPPEGESQPLRPLRQG